jgi:hypothetical protein
MSFKRLAITATVLLCCAAPAHAQAVKLRFHDGNAPLRAILSEWARQGGTTIVNAERVAGPPLTLELNAVPERQALDVLLRSVSGYMLGPRPAGTPGVSVFDRIMILPTSTPPANAPAPATGRGFPTPRQLMPQPAVMPPQFPQLPMVPSPDDIEEELPQDIDQDIPVVAPQLRPRPLPRDIMPQPGQPLPFEIPQDDPDIDPAEQPVVQPTRPTPGNPFGLPSGTTSRPGVVTPVPQGVPPRPPRTDPEP